MAHKKGPRWQEAASFAARRHKGQMRDDGETPYAAHPFRVAMTVRDVFGCGDEAALCAALLHDTIEDTATDYDDVAGAFGAEVADLVAALTKNMILPEGEREEDYHARLRKADWRARLVKLADQYDNFSDLGSGKKDRAENTRKKCREAIELARPDRKAHEETDRAIRALEKLIS
jgi:guanosine-3',5'-bis(diphosphate) 3'-pyrophosphohydrolase